MTTLVEIMLLGEKGLERRLCGLAILQPKVIAALTIRPEVDREAREFFTRFDQKKDEILAANEADAIRIAYGCCNPVDFFRFWAAVEDVNAYELAPNFGKELIAMRSLRKAVRWIETSGILKAVIHDIESI